MHIAAEPKTESKKIKLHRNFAQQETGHNISPILSSSPPEVALPPPPNSKPKSLKRPLGYVQGVCRLSLGQASYRGACPLQKVLVAERLQHKYYPYKGSKDSDNWVSRPKYYSLNGIWDLKPYYLSPWTPIKSPYIPIYPPITP